MQVHDATSSVRGFTARRTLLLAAGLFLGSSPAFQGLAGQEPPTTADALVGAWEGELEIPPAPAEVLVSLERAAEGWTGTFSLPAEGVRGIPMASVELEGDSVTLAVTPQRVFRGRVADGVIEGRIVFEDQGGQPFPMRLVRVDGPAWEAYEAEREAARAAREEEAAAHAPPALERTGEGPGVDRVDRDALDRLVQAANASHSSALVVLHEGELVGAWHAGGSVTRIEAMSVTKSVLNLAIGRLLALGLLDSPDVPVHAFYPEWAEGPQARVTVRHLLNHTSGLHSPMPTGEIYASSDFVRFALESELVTEPGAETAYNNNAANLLAGVIGRAAGKRLDRLLAEELFAPLGITDFTWSLDDAGNPHGMAGLQIRPRDLARLGQFALQQGEWEGERLIEPEWFEASFAPAAHDAESLGLLWWLIRDDDRVVGVRADGYLGQYLVIYPEDGLVGVRMIEGFPGYDAERDGFQEFQELLRRLVP